MLLYQTHPYLMNGNKIRFHLIELKTVILNTLKFLFEFTNEKYSFLSIFCLHLFIDQNLSTRFIDQNFLIDLYFGFRMEKI